MLEQVQGKALEPRLRSSKKMLKGNPGANLVAGLASIAEVWLEGEEDLERSRVMFFTRPMFMKMSRSKEIESEMRFRWSEVAVKSWENFIMITVQQKSLEYVQTKLPQKTFLADTYIGIYTL